MKHAASMADLPDMERMRDLSGRAFMDAMLSGDLPAPPIAKTMNFELDTVEDGRVIFTGAPRFGHANPMGGLHGGWYGTVLDSAMACAVMTKVPRGSMYTTLEYKVNICRALALETPVRCVGIVSHSGRSTALASGEIRGVEDDCLYATGSTTCMIMALPRD